MADGSYCMMCGVIEKYCQCEKWGDAAEEDVSKGHGLGYYFEAMDRLHVLMNTIEDHLDNHPGIVNSGSQKNIDKAMKHLMKAYQKAGAKDFYEK